MADNLGLIGGAYEAFSRGDMARVFAAFAPDIVWHVPGGGPLSGDYRGHAEVGEFFRKFMELSSGTFRIEVNEVLARGDSVVVLCTESARRGQRTWSSPQVHVWTLREGLAVAFQQFQGDQQAEDEFWSARPRPRTPLDVQRFFVQRFNDEDLDGMLELYEDDALLVPTPGETAQGREAIRTALESFLALKGRMTLENHAVLENGDVALSISTWVLDGQAADGSPVRIVGNSSDVAHRQVDGTWKALIDNPFGTYGLDARPPAESEEAQPPPM